MSLYKTSIEKEDKTDKKKTRHFSSKQEKQVAKQLNGKVTPNSGATPFAPGDVKTDKFLIECKTRTDTSKSISIKKEWIEKIRKEALFAGKEYEALIFNFGPGEENFVIVDMNLFQVLLNYIESEDV